MANRWLSAGIPWGPGPAPTDRLIPETNELHWHFDEALKCPFPFLRQENDPMLIWCSQELLAMGPRVHQWRAWAIEELDDMVLDLSQQSDDWLAGRSEHVAKAY